MDLARVPGFIGSGRCCVRRQGHCSYVVKQKKLVESRILSRPGDGRAIQVSLARREGLHSAILGSRDCEIASMALSRE